MNLVGLYDLDNASYKKRHSRVLNKTIRKQLKISKKNDKNNVIKKIQNGGEIVSFQVYFFTEFPIVEPIKSQLMRMLIELYGVNISYTDDTISEQMVGKSLIKGWVEEKGGKYIQKAQILGFSINTIPEQLKDDMDDDKLTYEEDNINTALRKKKLPFKLTKGQPGIWTPELAIIAFENK